MRSISIVCPQSVQALAAEAGLGAVCSNPFRSIIVRAIEIVYACEEALRLIAAYEPPERSVGADRTARRASASAAPRRRAASAGIGTRSKPTARSALRVSCRRRRRTSRASKRISRPLRRRSCAESDDVIRDRCEQSIRNYDPCISCSTHFLKLSVHRT